ncbi:MAG TPA: PH domain-containing protein [Hyphomicrobiales bacterium]|jgi:uncharacterized membrane protein YdbT with pleckstrin-like domain
MGYVEESLGANETVHYVGHFHWMNYVLAYGALIISLILGLFTYAPKYPALALISPFIGIIIFLAVMVPIWTTEIAVTNQRIILKRGLIKRITHELQLRAIEEVNLDQDVLGRILNYGKISVYGTGEEEIVFPTLGDPLGLRRAMQEAIGQAQNTTAPTLDPAAAPPVRKTAIPS